jgi:hypothetical protein
VPYFARWVERNDIHASALVEWVSLRPEKSRRTTSGTAPLATSARTQPPTHRRPGHVAGAPVRTVRLGGLVVGIVPLVGQALSDVVPFFDDRVSEPFLRPVRRGHEAGGHRHQDPGLLTGAGCRTR